YAVRLGSIAALVSGPAAGLAVAAVGTLAKPLVLNQSVASLGVIIGPTYGLLAGGIVAALYGGLTVVQHLALRLVLLRRGVIPVRSSRFLDYAAERIFLRKVGGGYIFVHRLLLEYFASLKSESSKPDT